MQSIFVAGGAGYIGAQTCKALAAAGYLPVALDNLSTGYRQAVKWGPLHETNIRDEAVVAALIGQYRPVGAIHFAASNYLPRMCPERAIHQRDVPWIRFADAVHGAAINQGIKQRYIIFEKRSRA